MQSWAKGGLLAAILVVILGLGFGLGAAFPVGGDGSTDNWDIIRPAGTPPPWVFATVWSIIYLLLAIALWWTTVMREGLRKNRVSGTSTATRAVVGVIGAILVGLLSAWMPAASHSWTAALVIIMFALLVTFVLLTFMASRGLWEATLLAPLFVWLLYAADLNRNTVHNVVVADAVGQASDSLKDVAQGAGLVGRLVANMFHN
jgi:benzodiazapine receptor